MGKKTVVAYIGTGNMGRPMISTLLELGYCVRVYDKYRSAAEPSVQAGAAWCDSPALAAQDAETVMTNLPRPEHVTENMLGANGALAGMKPGATWIDFSTTDYHNTKQIAQEARARGVYSLEAPVSNLSHMGVDFGNTSFYISGDREGFDRSKEVLDGVGKVSFFVMDRIGEAQAVKLLTNLLCYTSIVVLGEVLTIAKIQDVPLDWMWEYLKASSANSFSAEQISPFIFDGSYDRSCSLEIAVKDMSLTLDLANELNVSLPLGAIVEARYRQTGEQYGLSENYIIVTKLVEAENQLDLRLPGFVAPSPYGADENYVLSGDFETDPSGRVKPHPYRFDYDRPQQVLSEDRETVARVASEFAAYINYLALQEAYALGEGMGIDRGLLTKVIRWGCGCSWVSENEDTYQPHPDIVAQFKALNVEQTAHLPALSKILCWLSEDRD